jgi:hypothetical protein
MPLPQLAAPGNHNYAARAGIVCSTLISSNPERGVIGKFLLAVAELPQTDSALDRA